MFAKIATGGVLLAFVVSIVALCTLQAPPPTPAQAVARQAAQAAWRVEYGNRLAWEALVKYCDAHPWYRDCREL